MKIQFFNGGLANQAFQYIFSRYHELSHPGDKMFLDDTYFALYTVHNGYELEKVFGIRPHMLSECFDEKVWAFILEEKRKGKSVPQILREQQIQVQMVTEAGNYSQFNPFDGAVFPIPNNAYHPEILEVPGNTYYHGYWINKNWFERYREIFLQEFTFPPIADERNRRYQEEILSAHSVSVHVRRGDYVALGWALGTELYREAAHRFVEQAQVQAGAKGGWHLFVFSDDIGWCRENAGQLGFGAFSEVTYVEGNVEGENYRDLQLMRMCEAMIISNSAFSYLAALLNTRRKYVLNLSDRRL